jgi:hypothetical protein
MKALISALSLLAFLGAATVPSVAFAKEGAVHKSHKAHKASHTHKASSHHKSHRKSHAKV